VENVDGGWKACSGCAGDYEDPERSAWEADEEEDDGEDDGEAVKGRKVRVEPEEPKRTGEEG
jgi:hypothetical protein